MRFFIVAMLCLVTFASGYSFVAREYMEQQATQPGKDGIVEISAREYMKQQARQPGKDGIVKREVRDDSEVKWKGRVEDGPSLGDPSQGRDNGKYGNLGDDRKGRNGGNPVARGMDRRTVLNSFMRILAIKTRQ